MGRIPVDGAELAVAEEGTGGPPILFLHGLATDRSVWESQFEDLKRDHRCIAVDLRGCGRSQPAGPGGLSMVADDLATVSRLLRLGPAVVVGHGIGGLVALVLNHRHPELVLGIALGDSPVGARDAGQAIADLRDRLEAGGPAELLGFVERQLSERAPDDARGRVLEAARAAAFDAALALLDAGLDPTDWDALVREADRKPFMAIWASHPAGVPGRMREITMFLRQEPVAESGHFFQLERPAVTSALIRAFLDDVARDPRIEELRSMGA